MKTTFILTMLVFSTPVFGKTISPQEVMENFITGNITTVETYLKQQNNNKDNLCLLEALEQIKKGEEDFKDCLTENQKNFLLILAIKSGEPSVALSFINNGANPNIQNEVGTTPLHLASRRGDTKFALALIDNGADIEMKIEKEKTLSFIKEHQKWLNS